MQKPLHLALVALIKSSYKKPEVCTGPGLRYLLTLPFIHSFLAPVKNAPLIVFFWHLIHLAVDITFPPSQFSPNGAVKGLSNQVPGTKYHDAR